MNPLVGENPSTGTISAISVGLLAASWWLTEYWADGWEYQQEYRNVLYGLHTVAHGWAALHNSSLDCY